MTTTQKAWKLQDFVAHAANVTCLAVGPSSGRVMVTGGEDRKVNMWAIGQPNAIMSLSGHTTPIKSVKFNASEELVVAGSQSGSLKIWDLEAAKIVRTLTGHKSNVQCLDFHPYGDFVASGSLDTNVKLWDVRRKGCIFTYKGHTDAVNSMKFSPDGRWLLSAGEDSMVKLWDLTAGKMLNEFVGHTAAVNCIEFHPKEFLMASGSSDRTVKFWDLETFALVSTSTVEQSAVRCARFHPEGTCLFSASQDSLRAYGWEPMKCYDSQTLSWGKVADCSFSSEQLIGASFSQTNVSVWVVDLHFVRTSMDSSSDDAQSAANNNDQLVAPEVAAVATSASSRPSPSRKSFITRPKTSSSKQRKSVSEDVPTTAFANDGGGGNYDNAFKPRQNLPRSPRLARKQTEPFKAPEPSSDDSFPAAAPSSTQPQKESLQVTPMPNAADVQSDARVDRAHTKQVDDLLKLKEEQRQQQQQQQQLLQQQQQLQEQLRQQQENFLKQQQQQQQQKQQQHQPPLVRPLESHLQPKEIQRPPNFMDDDEILSHLHKDHVSFCSIMEARLKNLSLIGRLWTEGEIKTAVETATVMPEPAVLIDLLNVLMLKQTLWTLDICVVVLPQLNLLLGSKHDSYIDTAANSLKLILKNFAPVIKSNMAAPPVSVGVDLVREERYQKCQRCHSHLLSIRDMVAQRMQQAGRPGTVYRQLSAALNTLG